MKTYEITITKEFKILCDLHTTTYSEVLQAFINQIVTECSSPQSDYQAMIFLIRKTLGENGGVD